MNFEAQLPNVIDVDFIGRISDIKSIWRQGIKELELTFQEHIGRISD